MLSKEERINLGEQIDDSIEAIRKELAFNEQQWNKHYRGIKKGVLVINTLNKVLSSKLVLVTNLGIGLATTMQQDSLGKGIALPIAFYTCVGLADVIFRVKNNYRSEYLKKFDEYQEEQKQLRWEKAVYEHCYSYIYYGDDIVKENLEAKLQKDGTHYFNYVSLAKSFKQVDFMKQTLLDMAETEQLILMNLCLDKKDVIADLCTKLLKTDLTIQQLEKISLFIKGYIKEEKAENASSVAQQQLEPNKVMLLESSNPIKL